MAQTLVAGALMQARSVFFPRCLDLIVFYGGIG